MGVQRGKGPGHREGSLGLLLLVGLQGREDGQIEVCGGKMQWSGWESGGGAKYPEAVNCAWILGSRTASRGETWVEGGVDGAARVETNFLGGAVATSTSPCYCASGGLRPGKSLGALVARLQTAEMETSAGRPID